MKLLGLDLGSRTLGIAHCDNSGILASALVTLRFEEDDYAQALELLEPVIQSEQPTKVVLGLPRHMNGTVGERGEISLSFGESLKERFGLEVIYWDERWSTVSALKQLRSSNVKQKKRRQVVDQVAAVVILQGYLDSLR
ncbi:MAG: Holliday junction resolvase RuvX [Erysipelotrichaceae bacterium]|jgi:putative Holliday junction resolvase|nr:Holliday junction resolvase RuvX [Erysipelotrichaceae bacterium]